VPEEYLSTRGMILLILKDSFGSIDILYALLIGYRTIGDRALFVVLFYNQLFPNVSLLFYNLIFPNISLLFYNQLFPNVKFELFCFKRILKGIKKLTLPMPDLTVRPS